MATTYKVLGQTSPAASANTDIYTVPNGAQSVCSTLAVCNRGVSTQYRVAVRPAGASIANQHFIVYDSTVNQYDTVFLTLGLTLSGNDVVTVYNTNGNTTFNLFGSEIV